MILSIKYFDVNVQAIKWWEMTRAGRSGKAQIGTEQTCFVVEVLDQILSGDESEKQVEDEFRALETEFCLAEYNQDD